MRISWNQILRFRSLGKRWLEGGGSKAVARRRGVQYRVLTGLLANALNDRINVRCCGQAKLATACDSFMFRLNHECKFSGPPDRPIRKTRFSQM
jgi:hypothetical protein